jgi:hypothetical protein
MTNDAWTTGGDASLVHKKRIGGGGSGTVHEVEFILKAEVFLINSIR